MEDGLTDVQVSHLLLVTIDVQVSHLLLLVITDVHISHLLVTTLKSEYFERLERRLKKIKHNKLTLQQKIDDNMFVFSN